MSTTETAPTGAPSNWDEVMAQAPAALGALADTARQCWALVDPVLLELCRLRMATLLRATADLSLRSPAATAAGLSEERIAALPAWPSSPLFSEAERAVLCFAEQFVYGGNTVTDEQVAAVVAATSSATCLTLTHALWAFEALQRTCLTFGIAPDPAALGLVAAGGPS